MLSGLEPFSWLHSEELPSTGQIQYYTKPPSELHTPVMFHVANSAALYRGHQWLRPRPGVLCLVYSDHFCFIFTQIIVNLYIKTGLINTLGIITFQCRWFRCLYNMYTAKTLRAKAWSSHCWLQWLQFVKVKVPLRCILFQPQTSYFSASSTNGASTPGNYSLLSI